MARTDKRKNNLETPDFTGVLEDQGEVALAFDDDDSPIATEKHRIVTEFVTQREVKDLPISGVAAKSLPQSIVATQSVPVHPQDEVEVFLREISESTAGWELYIYRLPRYEIDNKTDPKSRTRVGKLPFSWDYEQEIQRRWARPGDSNHFVIVAKKDGQHVQNGTLPIFSCEPLPIEERIFSGADQLPTVQQPAAASVAVPYPAPIIEQQFVPSPKEQLKEALELVKMVQGITGTVAANATPAAAPIDPEVAVLQLLAKDETVLNRLSKGLIGKIFGDAKDEPDPWAEVAKEAIRNGQAAELLKVGINTLFQGIQGFIPQRQQPPPADQQPMQQPQPTVAPAGVTTASAEAMQSPTPAEQLLGFVLAQCARNSPCEAVADGVMTFADQINQADPLNSVDWYIQAFALMTTDEAIKFVNDSIPGSEQVTTLQHAKAWTAELQQLLKQNYEGDEADDKHQPDAENVE